MTLQQLTQHKFWKRFFYKICKPCDGQGCVMCCHKGFEFLSPVTKEARIHRDAIDKETGPVNISQALWEQTGGSNEQQML